MGLSRQVSNGESSIWDSPVCQCPPRKDEIIYRFSNSVVWDPFIWFDIMENPKELWFMWVMCVDVCHMKN